MKTRTSGDGFGDSVEGVIPLDQATNPEKQVGPQVQGLARQWMSQ